jgi:NAD(P)-dependent dehydrogenase (short-subunit alcohol dehydrogenase family)
VLRQTGHIDVVNNAGLATPARSRTSVDEARQQFETNFFSMPDVSPGPAADAATSGRIVNMSSLGGRVGVPFKPCTARPSLRSRLTRKRCVEVRPFGIRVAMVGRATCHAVLENRRMTAAASSAVAVRRALRDGRPAHGEDESKNRKLVRSFAPQSGPSASRPRLRYPAANALQRTLVALQPLLPQPLFEYLVMDNYGIR